MKPASKAKGEKAAPAGPHKKATYTLPPDVLDAVDEHRRFHETLEASLADSKSEYAADLIRRDAVRKNANSERRS